MSIVDRYGQRIVLGERDEAYGDFNRRTEPTAAQLQLAEWCGRHRARWNRFARQDLHTSCWPEPWVNRAIRSRKPSPFPAEFQGMAFEYVDLAEPHIAIARWCQSHALHWRWFAMLILRSRQWPYEWIGKVWNHEPGHVWRCIQRLITQLVDDEVITE